ncbi:DNA (cytosine-5)-methyltransferase 1 [Ochrobactrum anthropi]|uniref:DNA cytosine methyltransferase n=1 Tax=Brucella anthropi TaxID=529 RepID=UPI0015FCB914|nr:DNA cytosine methyltransferase [Brucella anthropi]MBA8858909.1 DNA (cytosine-5)-methyltransferase 1 [Brucella anthropi]
MEKEKNKDKELLSLFCGCGGLDLGFHQEGFRSALGYDKRPESIASWETIFPTGKGILKDISTLTLEQIDADYGERFEPIGLIGGPPCQGFSLANRYGSQDDPRNVLVHRFFDLALQLNERSPLKFIVMENVPALAGKRGGNILSKELGRLDQNGFNARVAVLDAVNYSVPQRRKRLFLVAYNRRFTNEFWSLPPIHDHTLTVRDAIGGFPEPLFFGEHQDQSVKIFHPNHWCMVPRSPKFTSGELFEGYVDKRSFKTLSWDKPSYTASYGNREIHVHPNCKRRLSVFEAMVIQGFPKTVSLMGTLSAQIRQVSEAVPPPLARVVAQSVLKQL